MTGYIFKSIGQVRRRDGIVTVHDHRADGVSLVRHKSKGIGRVTGHGDGHIRGDAAARARQRGQVEHPADERRAHRMRVRDILKLVGADSFHFRTVHHNPLYIIAFFRCNGHGKRLTAVNQRVADRRDDAAFARFQTDIVAFLGEERTDRLRTHLIRTRQCAGRHRAHIHPVHHHRVDGVAGVRMDGVGLRLSASHRRRAGRLDLSAIFGCGHKRIPILGEVCGNLLVPNNIFKDKGRNRALIRSVHHHRVDGVATIGDNAAGHRVTAKHRGRSVQCDLAAPFAMRGYDIFIPREIGLDILVFNNICKDKGRDRPPVRPVHHHRVDGVASVGDDAACHRVAAGHLRSPVHSDAATHRRLRSHRVSVLREKGPHRLVGPVAGQHKFGLCPDICIVNQHRVERVAGIANGKIHRSAARKHRIGGVQVTRTVCVGDGNAVVRQPSVIDLQQLVRVHVRNRVERRILQQRIDIRVIDKIFRDVHIVQESRMDVVALSGQDVERGRPGAVDRVRQVLQPHDAIPVVLHFELVMDTGKADFEAILLTDVVQRESGDIATESE